VSKNGRGRRDPVEQQIALAFCPGDFVYDRACFSFVSGLERVANDVAGLIGADPGRAVALFETMLAGCYEKADEVDDSSGHFGQFAQTLFCGWVKARQAADADRDETATRLLRWMNDDPFGFCVRIEKDIAKALDARGRAAFEKQVRARFELAAAAKAPSAAQREAGVEYLCRKWGAVLREVLIARRDVAAYVSLAERTGISGQDCHVIATLLASRRRPEEALAWVERGVLIDGRAPYATSALHELTRLRRELLVRLGRGGEARDEAWAEFRKDPSKYSYDDLMKFVPKPDRRAWHEKAMSVIAGGDLGSLVELLLGTGETARLVELLRRASDETLAAESHHVTERAAKKLEKVHPDVAARLWRAQGLRIVNAKKSKYYAAAIRNFARAKCCYQRAGLAAEWEKTVIELRAAHHRKSGFMPGFEKIVAGARPIEEPSFLDRARARWDGRHEENEP
jgi:hypothetical protein